MIISQAALNALRVGFNTAFKNGHGMAPAMKDRVAMNAAVADDNRDRKAVYREVAVANGHPEWESQIREVFARQWATSARPGWWYESGGSWKQK